jgi:hypothetical protein
LTSSGAPPVTLIASSRVRNRPIYRSSTRAQDRGVTLIGADLDESPMAYRRLPEVIAQHAGTVKVLHTLRPFAVVMAGTRELDPWKD